jgi:hypothetical protein
MGMHGKWHASAALPPGKKPFAHSTGDWMILIANLDRCREEKIPVSSGVQTPNHQPVVFRYTE